MNGYVNERHLLRQYEALRVHGSFKIRYGLELFVDDLDIYEGRLHRRGYDGSKTRTRWVSGYRVLLGVEEEEAWDELVMESNRYIEEIWSWERHDTPDF